jgi:hypothetical protein
MTATSVPKAMDREFLGIRCRLVELAATFDRLAREQGVDAGDPRLAQIRHSLEILLAGEPNCAERVQMAFSLPYEKRD